MAVPSILSFFLNIVFPYPSSTFSIYGTAKKKKKKKKIITEIKDDGK